MPPHNVTAGAAAAEGKELITFINESFMDGPNAEAVAPDAADTTHHPGARVIARWALRALGPIRAGSCDAHTAATARNAHARTHTRGHPRHRLRAAPADGPPPSSALTSVIPASAGESLFKPTTSTSGAEEQQQQPGLFGRLMGRKPHQPLQEQGDGIGSASVILAPGPGLSPSMRMSVAEPSPTIASATADAAGFERSGSTASGAAAATPTASGAAAAAPAASGAQQQPPPPLQAQQPVATPATLPASPKP